MEKQHIIMLKQHKKTGLKYLCYHYGTEKNCYRYRGSGKYWTRHLSKHGYAISTIILSINQDIEDAKKDGLKYSKLWDVVESKEFANLTEECCQTNAEPLQRPEVRRKRNEALKERIRGEGLTEKEKKARRKGVIAMQDPNVREQAAKSLKDTWDNPEKNKNLLNAVENRKQRLSQGNYTEAELAAHEACSKRQKGKTMKERCGEDWKNPRKGKPSGRPAWNKGKKSTEIHGEDYIDPRSKPFQIKSHLGAIEYKSESDFIKQTKFSGPNLSKLKRDGEYTVKRQKNTKHPYNHGETIFFSFI